MKKYRSFLERIIVFTSITILLSDVMSKASANDSKRPDFILMMLDDSGYTDFNVYGSEIDTPNIDKLASEGMRFTDCHAAAPNCSPSRAGMLTGRMPTRVGMYSYIPPAHPMHLKDSEITIAEILKKQGYATGHFGKWHLSQLGDNHMNQPQPKDQGFDYSLGTTNNAQPSHKEPENFVRNGIHIGKTNGFSCQIVANEFIRWSNSLQSDTPMLSVIWFHEPHTPIGSPDDLVEKYSKRDGVSIKQAKYYANIENVDIAVGRILNQLNKTNRDKDAFVFLTSDNGGVNAWSNKGLRGKKSFVYEGGHREPGILRFPGKVKPGTMESTPVSHLDLLPTICDLVDIPIPQNRKLDGTSWTPLLEGKALKRTTPLFWFFYRVKPAAAMRSGDWIVLGYLDDPIKKHTHPLTSPDMPMIKSAPLTRFELYNLKNDPKQLDDLANQEKVILEKLSTEMKAIHKEVVSEGPTWDLSNWKN